MTLALIGVEAEDPKTGLTFKELRLFVQEGMRAGMADGAAVGGKLGWRQQVQKLQVTGSVEHVSDET